MTDIFLNILANPTKPASSSCGLRRVGLLATSALVAVWSPAALAQSTGPIDVPLDVIFDIGVLDEGENAYSIAEDVNADGSVVVGYSRVNITENNWQYHAFVWTPEDGMVDIGTLGGTYSYARRVSADGNVAIGWSNLADESQQHAFRWTEAGGMLDLGTLGGNYSYAYDLSDDGAVVVGQSSISSDSSYRAFRWTQAGGMVNLGTLGGSYSYAIATNADGSVVVGEADLSAGAGNVQRAFRWTEAGGMVNLGTLGGDYSYATDVDAAGAIVIGHSSIDAGNYQRAFRWTQAGGMQSLGTLGGDYSYARHISRDGSTIIGHSNLQGNSFTHSFRWTEATGMQDLGTLGGTYSYGEDVSADGEVIVGYSQIAGEDGSYHAFRWTEDDGMVDIGTLGGDWSYASAVSDDGSTVVGYSETSEDGRYRAFIYRTQIQDFTNMIASFGTLANDLALTTEFQRDMTSWAVDGGCSPRADQQFCLGIDGLMTMTGADGAIGIAKREDQSVKFSAGLRFSEQIVMGISAVVSDYRAPIGAITPDNGNAFGAWIVYDSDPAAITGLSARMGAAVARQDNRFQRGIGLENVEVTPGESKISTTTIAAEFAYGFDIGGSIVLAPVVGIASQSSELDPFSEAPGDFPATFTGNSFDATFVTAGLELTIPVGTGGALTLGGLVEQDISNDDILLSGTSEIPGMETFAMPAGLKREETRPRAEVTFSQQVGPGVVTLFGRAGAPTFGDKARYAVGIGLGIGF